MSVDRILIDDPGGPVSEDERDAALNGYRQSFSNRIKDPRQKVDHLPDDIKSDNWKLLFFLKEGRAIRGLSTYSSEKEAEKIGIEDDKAIKCYGFPFFIVTYRGENGEFTNKEYSHFMVIPWNKK